MLASCENVAGVSLLLPMVRKNRLSKLNTSCKVVSTLLDWIVDASTSALGGGAVVEEDEAEAAAGAATEGEPVADVAAEEDVADAEEATRVVEAEAAACCAAAESAVEVIGAWADRVLLAGTSLASRSSRTAFSLATCLMTAWYRVCTSCARMNSEEFFLSAVSLLRMLMRDSRMGNSSGGMADMLLDTPDMMTARRRDAHEKWLGAVVVPWWKYESSCDGGLCPFSEAGRKDVEGGMNGREGEVGPGSANCEWREASSARAGFGASASALYSLGHDDTREPFHAAHRCCRRPWPHPDGHGQTIPISKITLSVSISKSMLLSIASDDEMKQVDIVHRAIRSSCLSA